MTVAQTQTGQPDTGPQPVQPPTEQRAAGGASAALRRLAQPRQLLHRLVLPAIGLLLIAVAWELIARAANSRSFPTFLTSVRTVRPLMSGTNFADYIWPSIKLVIVGFLVSSVIGAVLGLVIGLLTGLNDWIRPVLEFMRAAPPPLLIPLMILIFGLQDSMVIATIVLGAVWPVLINTQDAVRRVEPLYLDTARAAGMRGVRLLRRLLLPAALPQIFAGMRVGLGISIALMIIAQLLGGSLGIGFLIANSEQTFQVPQTYGCVIILAIMGWVLDTVLLGVEKVALSWQRGVSHELFS